MKSKVLHLVWICTGSFVLWACIPNAPADIVYQDLISGSAITYRLDERRVQSADLIDQIEVCDSAQFYCLSDTLGFGFSVPKSLDISLGSGWAMSGIDYQVVDRKARSILGKSYDLIVIRAKNEEFAYEFYFDKAAGIIAFRAIEGPSQEFPLWILTSESGLFAN